MWRREIPLCRVIGPGRGLALFAMLAAGGCSCSCARDDRNGTRPPAGRGDDASAVEAAPKTMRVGNQAGGIDDMPDYELEAQQVRDAVVDRLPDPLPQADAACATMLKAVHRHYVDQDGEQAQSVEVLEQTRDADLVACRERTTPAAAACVTVLMHEQQQAYEPVEYPKLLDQCTRAFPRSS